MDLAHVQLTIDGIDTPPALRLDLPAPALLPPADPAWLTRLSTARAAFDACQPALDLADMRLQLSRAVLALLPAGPGQASVADNPAPPPATAQDQQTQAPAQPEPQSQPQASVVQTVQPPSTTAPALRPLGFDLPLPALIDQQALLRFVASNLARAQAERHAAAQARLAAQSQLEQLDAERERQRPPQTLSASMRLAGAGGHSVHLRYLVDEAAWTPCYRVEVAAGRVTLVSEALIDVPRDQHWGAGTVELMTRSPARELFLRELTIPVLELGNEVVVERQLDQRRMVGKYGGARGSDSMLDGALRISKRTMRDDGSWSGGAWSVHATALTLLELMGAGYDHMTPNKYRQVVASGLDWLRQQPTPSDLTGAALTLMALSEAAAMTNDRAVKAAAANVLAEVARRVVQRHELGAEIFRSGPGEGPLCLAWMALAARSAHAAGLNEPLSRSLEETVAALVPQLTGHGDHEAAAIARLLVLSLHHDAGNADQPPVSGWLERLDAWIAEGRPELIYMASLGLFQYGGDAWQLWNRVVRDRLLKYSVVGQRNGFLAITPDPMGEDWTRAILSLPLEIYYRYVRVESAQGASSGLFAARSGSPDPVLEPLPEVTGLAHHWPLRIEVGAAQLADGLRSRVVLSRTELPGPVRLRAAPQDGAGAWRVLATVNPLSVPLLQGPLDVEVDGERIGLGQLPFTEPSQPLILDLGRDDRVLVHRTEEHQDDEAWGKRTRTYTVKFSVEAPAGLYPSIRIDEAMPVPADATIQLLSLDPVVSPQDLDRRMMEDPVWHLDLDLGKGQPRAALVYQLHYPATVQPLPTSAPSTTPAANPAEPAPSAAPGATP